jgi:hypothetical protein
MKSLLPTTGLALLLALSLTPVQGAHHGQG